MLRIRKLEDEIAKLADDNVKLLMSNARLRKTLKKERFIHVENEEQLHQEVQEHVGLVGEAIHHLIDAIKVALEEFEKRVGGVAWPIEEQGRDVKYDEDGSMPSHILPAQVSFQVDYSPVVFSEGNLVKVGLKAKEEEEKLKELPMKGVQTPLTSPQAEELSSFLSPINNMSKKLSPRSPGTRFHAKAARAVPSPVTSGVTMSTSMTANVSVTEGRPRRRTTLSVNYVEPPLHSKLRQGDPYTFGEDLHEYSSPEKENTDVWKNDKSKRKTKKSSTITRKPTKTPRERFSMLEDKTNQG